MKHTLPALPFEPSSLLPYISVETLEFHHGKHHRAYIDKLNELIQGTEFEAMSLDEIVLKSNGAVFNNAGQAWNHSFYWNSLRPGSTELSKDFLRVIDKNFGSVDGFHQAFAQAALGVFGSGWVWLVQHPDGSLHIETTPNAENPIRAGKKPLLTCDVWEHAYYIDYRNQRAQYVGAFSKILNWKFAEENYFSTREELLHISAA